MSSQGNLKKAKQLGMSWGKARHRLVMDILFRMVVATGHKCFRCGGDLDRKTLSIEHKQSWLDSVDPVQLFFDLENIAFSHLACNVRHCRKPNASGMTPRVYKTMWDRNNRVYDPAKRRAQYLRTGN